jgi:hypothetical protein
MAAARLSADVTERDIGFAEHRQHLADVASKRGVRADHKNVTGVESVGVVEEQPGDPVQRDRGLAGARTTFNHEDLVQWRADEVELRGLDGGHDVTHGSVPAASQFAEQVGIDSVGELAEQHVREVQDRVALAAVRPLAGQPVRIGGAGLVIGDRRVGLPADHQDVALLITDQIPADVERLAVLGIDAPHRHRRTVAEPGELLLVERPQRPGCGPVGGCFRQRGALRQAAT